MHCPQCGQEVPEEVRFCKGCGFALSAVRELLATGGISPTDKESKPRISPRRRGVRQGAILLFIAMCLLPVAALLGEPGEVLPLIFVMAGLMRMLYARIFQEAAPSRDAQKRAPTYAVANRIEQGSVNAALPPAHGVPVTDFQASRGSTKEMIDVPSVTEQTTELLNKQPRHH